MSSQEFLLKIKSESAAALSALIEAARLKKGDIVIIGCSTSEVKGERIGTASGEDVAAALLSGFAPVADEAGIYLAAQCCEHLNRAVIISASALLPRAEIVNAVPKTHAGGSFAAALYASLTDPVAVEHIKADAGLDIGDTLIGMHLRDVAVPVRLPLKEIGCAHLVAARTRPKYIGGERAVYDPELAGGEVAR